MSYTDGSLQTQYLDPVSFVPNGRASWELDGDKMAYMSNMRLLDLGVTSNPAHTYSRGLGALACIKSIRLLDGRTELSALRNPAPYLFFKNANRSNAINKSNDSYFKKNQLGLEINSVDNKLTHIYTPGGATNDPATTSLCYLDLKLAFPFLMAVEIMPTSIFRNIRIEIEFDSKITNQIVNDVTAPITIQRPVLAVDYLTNQAQVDQVISEMNDGGQTWQEIEWDNFNIPAVDTSGFPPAEVKTQRTANQSLGYRGKIVERLLTCKQVVDKSVEVNDTNIVQGYGALASSQSVCDAKINYRLNGRNVLPNFGGVTRSNERLALLSDEWGSITTYPGGNLYQWANQASNMNDGAQFGGQMDWDCVRIGARVADLQLNMSRTNNRDTGKGMTNASLQVNMYAEVMKQIVFSKGRYDISYA
tara:strand:+ start:3269 stop:4525 length:1257 start_codon:yes stop_codon:yes gene_type:complete